jgi:hypothetical protein
MKEKTFPDGEAYPLQTPFNLYSGAFGIISRHWHETQSWSKKKPDSAEFEEYVFWRMNTVIWVCCSIESIANLEGMSWMGEEYYKNVVERLNITQKIRLIRAFKYNRQLPPDQKTLKRVSKLFNVRNQLVHPKTRATKNNVTRNDTSSEALAGYDPDTLQELMQDVYRLIRDPDDK